MTRRWVSYATAGLALAGAAASAKYAPPRFFELAGASDAVVLGEITRVRPKTFTLRVDDTIAGGVEGSHIEVVRFENWTCSHRWKPYKVGQREIAFLYELDAKDARETGATHGLMSAGDEGEWEIRGEQVSAQGFRVPGAPVHDDGEHEGQWLRLDDVVDAIRRYRACFSVSRRVAARPWAVAIISACDAPALAAYRQRSFVHDYLAQTSVDEQQRAEPRPGKAQ